MVNIKAKRASPPVTPPKDISPPDLQTIEGGLNLLSMKEETASPPTTPNQNNGTLDDCDELPRDLEAPDSPDGSTRSPNVNFNDYDLFDISDNEDEREDGVGQTEPVPRASWLQHPFLDDVARFMESILHQENPVFGPDEQLFDCDPQYLSKRATYLDDFNNCDDDMIVALKKQKFKSDVRHLAKKCNHHKCRMPGVCNKYDGDKCPFDYPRALVQATKFTNGVIQLKRLDHRCNNYNRSMMASLRCNMDVQMLTNIGQDVRACVFYITDYITKSELSIHDSPGTIRSPSSKGH